MTDTPAVPEWYRAAQQRAHEEAPDAPPARVQATQYTVNCLPENDINSSLFAITVEYRGRGLWAVCRHRQCLGRSGEWSWESIPSEREDEWLAEHRFDLDTALELAKKTAPLVTVNGHTATDAFKAAEEES